MSPRGEQRDPVETARDYYNSGDADRFYATIWGGEDIHVGIYESAEESITRASRRTVERIAARLPELGADTRVLDLGSGFGGAARYLARTHGWHVTGLNLSEVENQRARSLCRQRGLDELVTIVDGSFEKVPFEDDSFDVAWSQDAILHSGARKQVLAEVARVLKPGGHFVFTDPMAADDCPEGVLDPILRRIHLSSLSCPSTYQRIAEEVGLRDFEFEDLTEHLVRHYRRVLEETRKRQDELAAEISREYLQNMQQGLSRWIEGGEAGYLSWGIFHLRR